MSLQSLLKLRLKVVQCTGKEKKLLILARKVNQGIWIEGNILIKVLEVERDRVKLGISAPQDIKVMRQELLTETSYPFEEREENVNNTT
jgi:carbon storage regulator CsrA